MCLPQFGLYSGNVAAVQELLHLTPVYEQVEGGWTHATIRELPGVITAAPSREEAQEMLLDALREFLLSFGPAARDLEGPESSEDDLTLTVSIGSTHAA
jgi:hypothetical protein